MSLVSNRWVQMMVVGCMCFKHLFGDLFVALFNICVRVCYVCAWLCVCLCCWLNINTKYILDTSLKWFRPKKKKKKKRMNCCGSFFMKSLNLFKVLNLPQNKFHRDSLKTQKNHNKFSSQNNVISSQNNILKCHSGPYEKDL